MDNDEPSTMTALPAVLVNRFAIFPNPQVSRIVFCDADQAGHETPRVAVAETLAKLMPN